LGKGVLDRKMYKGKNKKKKKKKCGLSMVVESDESEERFGNTDMLDM
jgi:hypothetical protein